MRTQISFALLATVMCISPALAQQPAMPNPASMPFVAGTPLKHHWNAITNVELTPQK